MNGIERITERISGDARKESEQILAEARSRAEEILSGYRAQAEAEGKELRERGARAAAEREERLAGTAQMEARKTILAARQEVVEAAYVRALDRLCSMPEAQYVDALAALLTEASSTGTEEAVFSAKDQKAGKAAVAKADAASGKKITLSRETADIRGGFLLKGKNVEVNCAFETLVRLQKTETAGAVAKLLFP